MPRRLLYLCAMNLAARIDHTLLRPDCTEAQILQLCDEAAAHGFATVCVPPCYVALAAAKLEGTAVGICTVIGFPLGYAASSVKFKEAEVALYDGATELDMVLNISALKSGKTAAIQDEILDLADLCHVHQALLKVIIETALLSEEEMVLAAQLCVAGEADFVKTSTGFASRGASVADVELLRRSLPENVRIKAAGGIRTREAALALVAAGADRIGSSNSVALITSSDEPTASE
jgi:deoxyribose-phosphate aldolase